MSKRIRFKRNVILAPLAAASLACAAQPSSKASHAPDASRWATTTAQGSSASNGVGGTSATTPGADTAYSRPYWDTTAGGTGMGTLPGRGGSAMDSAYGRDTLWSSPYNQPATPGTGLPNYPGSGQPGTGAPGSSGNGGSGTGGSGMGYDSSLGAPGKTSPATPGTGGTAPRDSIGAPDWMERG
jgi:hypothetical protein